MVLGKGWALNVAKGQHTSRGACRRKNDNQVVGRIKHNDDRLSILACVHTVSTVVYSCCTKKQLKCRQKRWRATNFITTVQYGVGRKASGEESTRWGEKSTYIYIYCHTRSCGLWLSGRHAHSLAFPCYQMKADCPTRAPLTQQNISDMSDEEAVSELTWRDGSNLIGWTARRLVQPPCLSFIILCSLWRSTNRSEDIRRYWGCQETCSMREALRAWRG